MKTVYVRLDEHEFAALVRGDQLILSPIGERKDMSLHIVLAKIDYARMLQIIDWVMNGDDPPAGC